MGERRSDRTAYDEAEYVRFRAEIEQATAVDIDEAGRLRRIEQAGRALVAALDSPHNAAPSLPEPEVTALRAALDEAARERFAAFYGPKRSHGFSRPIPGGSGAHGDDR